MTAGVLLLHGHGRTGLSMSFLASELSAEGYATLAPSPLETLEALEQLRALWHGYRISLLTLPHAPAAGVDTPEDLARVRALFDHQAKLA